MNHQFPFETVDGYLSSADRLNLKMLAERQSNVFGSFAEVGSYKGLSALCIMAGNTSGKYLDCFDYFEPDKLMEFERNIGDAVYWHVVPHVGDFKNAKFDSSAFFSLVWVDHSHTLEDTKAAYDMFWPKLSPGGVMAFHDFRHPDYPEPTEFLESLPHKRILETSILAFEK